MTATMTTSAAPAVARRSAMWTLPSVRWATLALILFLAGAAAYPGLLSGQMQGRDRVDVFKATLQVATKLVDKAAQAQ